MKGKSLILLTNGFPYEKGEQFLETEIQYLAKQFEKIYIYPISWNGKKRDVPNNVEIIKFKKGNSFSVRKLFFKHIRIVLHLVFSEFLSSKRRKFYKGSFKYYFDSFMGILNDADNFYHHLKAKHAQDTLIYSYWFGPWGAIMSIVNDISKGKISFVTRVHGYDYDVNQRKEGFIPFRAYQMKKVAAIFPVSNYAFHIVKEEYASFTDIKTFRLGVEERGDNPWLQNKQSFKIVSCSSLIPLKRVYLIIELLNEMNLNINWVHFGSGELEQEILEKAKKLPNNITYEFKGQVANSEVVHYYQNNSIDLFVNVSELEGIPVSLMEAISFGIPIMGCNICGVPEIVTEQSGILVEKDFDIKSVALEVEDFLSMQSEKMIEFRKKVKDFWSENFKAKINYSQFINENLLQ